MKFAEFFPSFKEFLKASPTELLTDSSRFVFISDLHMGDGSRDDDLEQNRELILTLLSRWYLERGYGLILGGDIEDMQKFPFDSIKKAWGDLFELFDAFAARNSLWKLVGNHDLALLHEKNYPYQLYHGLKLEHQGQTLFCFHGHQASKLFAKHNYISAFIVRYLAKPLKVKNSSISKSSRQKFKTERRIYKACKKLRIVSVCGHTHRPLFESLSRYDNFRLRIENLLREYLYSSEQTKKKIAALIDVYRRECERIGKKGRRQAASRSLYEDGSMLIPCMFNSGCATGKNSVTTIEIDASAEGGSISLVEWNKNGAKKTAFATNEDVLEQETLEGTDITRKLLQQARLDHLFTRLELLVPEDELERDLTQNNKNN